MKYRLTNIKWDERDASKLPAVATIELPDGVEPYDLEQLLSDRLTDLTGAFSNGFEFERVEA